MKSGSACWWTASSDYAILMLRPDRPVWPAGIRAPSGSRATRPRKSSAATSRSSIPPEPWCGGWPEPRAGGGPQGAGRFEDEGWRVRKDGLRFWANVVITAIRDGTRPPSGGSAR